MGKEQVGFNLTHLPASLARSLEFCYCYLICFIHYKVEKQKVEAWHDSRNWLGTTQELFLGLEEPSPIPLHPRSTIIDASSHPIASGCDG